MNLKAIEYLNRPDKFVQEELGIDIKKFPKQREIINKFFEQDEHGIDKYKYLVLVCGMRSGKSYLTSIMALYQLFRFLMIPDLETWAYYTLGKELKFTTLHWICAATSEKQAYDTLFTKINQMFVDNVERGGFFSNFTYKIRKGEIEIKHGKTDLVVWTGPSHAKGGVGRTVAYLAIDEFAHLENHNKPPNGADYLFSFLSKSTMTLGTFGKVAVLSSPRAPDDPIMRKLEEAKSGRLPHSIWYHEPTWVMNPFESEEKLRAECPDEATFMRDFAAIPHFVTYVGQRPKFFSQKDLKFDYDLKNVLVDPDYSDDVPRYLGLDPAVRNDGFGIAIGYYDYKHDEIVIDGVKVFEPGDSIIDAAEVHKFIIDDVLSRFNVVGVSVDIDMYAEMNQALMELVPHFKKQHVTRKHYENFKYDLKQGKIRLVYDPILRKELLELEVVNERRVDHPKNGTKDAADAVVQCYSIIQELSSQVIPIQYFGVHTFYR